MKQTESTPVPDQSVLLPPTLEKCSFCHLPIDLDMIEGGCTCPHDCHFPTFRKVPVRHSDEYEPSYGLYEQIFNKQDTQDAIDQ